MVEARWDCKSPGEISRDLSRDSSRFATPEGPCPLHFLSALLNSCCLFPCDCFPCIIGNNRCFESRTQQSVSRIRQVQEERDCISGTLFLHSPSATEHVSFPLSFVGSCPLPAGRPSATRTRRQLPAGRAGSSLASQSSRSGNFLMIQRAFP